MKFAHISICARDWKTLAQFYIDVFGCELSPPGRQLSGPWVEKLTGIRNAVIKGVHLQLPGHTNGPTLEIFEYIPLQQGESPNNLNNPGFRHIAFQVEDVPSLVQKAISLGASLVGERVTSTIRDAGVIEVVYIRDIEGNIIEIQNWKRNIPQ